MKCQICHKKTKSVINSIKLPRSHSFRKKKNDKLLNFNFDLHQCNSCLTIQLSKYGLNKSYIPKFKWIKNNEPDSHLDYVIKKLEAKIKSGKKILFISNFDKKIFDYFKLKYKKKRLKILSNDYLKINKKDPNQFMIQESILKANFKNLKKKIGTFDVIVSCRMLEHTYRLKEFIGKLEILLKKEGEFIFEIPDSYKSLSQGDVAMLWEEHPLYFTKKTFSLAMLSLGYEVKHYKQYNYPQEDALIFFLKKSDKKFNLNNFSKASETKLSNSFAEKLSKHEIKIKKLLNRAVKKKKIIAIFGVGHRTITFVNYFKLNKYFSYFVDDNKNKVNLIFPGSDKKISNSSVFKDNKIDICFLSLNIDLENLIIQKLKKNINKIKFYSTSPDSRYFI